MKKYILLIVFLVYFASAQNCLNCKPNSCNKGICSQCESGFMLSNQGWCGIFTPIQECRVYDALVNNRCVECFPGRDLINQRCYQRPKDCLQADIFRQCTRCSPNFQLQKGKCYSRNIAQCPQASLAVSGFCQPIRAQNCLEINELGLCTRCSSGYTLISSRCFRVTSQSPCAGNTCQCKTGFINNGNCYQVIIDRCSLKRDAVYCIACERGFVAIDGICLQTVKLDDINCNVLAPLSDYCTGCNQDYFLNIDAFCYRNFNMTVCNDTKFFYPENGKCLYRDRRCDSIDMIGQTYRCLRCQEGHSLVNGICQRNICTRYAQNNVCVQAFIGYQLVPGAVNQFIRLPKNCLVIDRNGKCTQCSSYTNFTLMSASSNEYVCAYYDKNCQQYNSNGSCIRCVGQFDNNGYVLIDRLCLRKSQNCIIRDTRDLSKCITCVDGYHRDNVDQLCYANIDGCEIYLSGSNCKQCYSGYLLLNSKCYQTNLECVDYDANNMCRRCSLGLMPFRNLCVYYHPYCLQYGVDRVCSRAASGWVVQNGMSQTQKRYYEAFMSRGEQVRSRTGQVDLSGVNAGNSFQAGAYGAGAIISRFPYANLIHDKINSVNIQGQVISCNQGYTLVNGACILKVTNNCQYYSQDQICIRCLPNFTLNPDFTCTAGLQCASDNDVQNGRCRACPQGAILIGVNCFRFGNLALINQQLMSSAFYRYTLSNGNYIAWPRISNCKTQADYQSCAQCIPPFTNQGGVCIFRVQRCVDYGLTRGQVSGTCLACLPGYTYWFGQCRQLQCSAAGLFCQSCPTNYYYYFGICLSSIQTGCRNYQNGLCTLCNPGYYLSLQNQCLAEVPQCLTTNRDTGRCLECRSNFTLYRQICVNYIIYCQDYDSNNRCTRCQQNTINRTQLTSTGICLFLQGQCARVDENTRQCAQCNLGYSLIKQDNRLICVNIRQNCKTYDVRGRCTACNPKYTLRNNQCVTYLRFCIKYAADQLTCEQCADGTQLQPKQKCCVVADKNCFNFNSCFCTQCFTKFHLNETNGLCQPNMEGCDIQDPTTGKCIKCSALFYLSGQGICVYGDSVVNGCEQGYNLTLSQSQTYQCLKCQLGFQLNDTDKLCYGYNCKNYHPVTRQCISCPQYYKIFSTGLKAYCIPSFCETYIPGQLTCSKNQSDYQGGLIITINRTVIINYCTQIVNDKCTVCTNYRYPNTATQYALCYPYNCQSIAQFNCNKCKYGFGFDSRFPGSCVASFCTTLKNDGTCALCTLPYTLSSAGICQNRGCCQIYDNVKGICQQAKKYFFIQNNICSPVNCKQYNPSRIQSCIQCQKGFTLFPDGTCRVSNCQSQTFTGDSCITCNKGFKPQYNTITLKSVCWPRYCNKISDDWNKCLQCSEGFTLDSDGYCRARFCSVYLPSLVCQSCNPYLILNQAQRCVADCSVGNLTMCKCCKYGFTLNVTSRLCQPVNSFCSRMSQSSGLCQQCLSPYILISGQCITPVANCKNPSLFGCTSCDFGYQLVDGCRCQPKNCLSIFENNTCQKCHIRFQLVQGKCKTRDCKMWSAQTWSCSACYPRFSYRDGICVTNDCDVWQDPTNLVCKKCQVVQYFSSTNFVSKLTMQLNLTNGGCYIRYCKNDSRDMYCTQCFPGFNRTMNGLCECININPHNNQCICPSGFVFNNLTGVCEINRDICLQRNNNGVCIQCPYQYQEPGSNGGQCIPLYCRKWDVLSVGYVECRQCYANFKPNNGFCQSSLCLRYETRAGFLFPQCASCPTGYSAVSNYCIPSRCQASTFNLQTGQCKRCPDIGYILSPDKTRCMVANCEVQYLFDQCSKCKHGFYNFTGLCIAMNCTQFDRTTCTKCDTNFQLKDQICSARNCAKFNQNNLCVECNAGFKLQANLTCLRNFCDYDSPSVCISCFSGFRFNTNTDRCEPSNCKTISPNFDACLLCILGYYNQNGTCLDIMCDRNSFTKQFVCTKCKIGYSFNANGLCFPSIIEICPPGKYFSQTQKGCVTIPVPNCTYYVNNRCVWCYDGYFLVGDLCISNLYCKVFSYFSGCLECMPGYTAIKGECKQSQNDSNCLSYVDLTCVACVPGTYLATIRQQQPSGSSNKLTICISSPENCQQIFYYSSSKLECASCKMGYTLSQGLCLSADANCVQYANDGTCSRCKDGYSISTDINGKAKCQVSYKYCLLPTSTGCKQCMDGYVLQASRCYKRFDNCIRYSESTQFCVQCNTNYTLSGVECICSLDSQIISGRCYKLPRNCIQVSPSTFLCIRCAQNYYLTVDYKCLQGGIQKPPANCAIYNATTRICLKCFPGYILANNQCKNCDSGFVQVADKCIRQIVGCQSYFSNQACQVCYDGYNLNNGLCIKIVLIRFCVSYFVDTGFCRACSLGYTLSNNLCTLNNCLTSSDDGTVCLRCQDPYKWLGNLCGLQIEFCINYQMGSCVACESFAYLNQSRCVPNSCANYDYFNGICLSCISGYQLLSRRCFEVIVACQQYYPNGLCRICLPGYNLQNNRCDRQFQNILNCQAYNQTTSLCIICSPGYTLSADFKLCRLNNCEIMDPSNSICTKCVFPFSWYSWNRGSLCAFVTDFCQAYGLNGYCSSCVVSFSSLSRNRCVPFYCSGYNYQRGVCETCNTGYALSLTYKRCFLTIMYCVSYLESGMCNQCQTGYALSNNGASCSKSSVQSCYAQSSQTCLRCLHRFYTSTQFCIAYLQYCINIQPFTNRCLSCCFGSRLLPNGTCQRDTRIKYCALQIANVCLECQNGYSYCDFCQACLPVSPNCKTQNSGECFQCYENFMLKNGVCVAMPVGYVLGAVGTCRSGYTKNGQNCYRNANQLSSATLKGYNTMTSQSGTFLTTSSPSAVEPLIIFGISITSRSIPPSGVSFLLYYRSKITDPFVCWNSCIATKIQGNSYSKDLVHPIIARQVNMYFVNEFDQAAQNFDIRNVGLEWRVL